MFADGLHGVVMQRLSNVFARAKRQKLVGAKKLNDSLVEIPRDEKRYDATDEFSFVLKPSTIGGIGVFSTHGIVKGTMLALFPNLRTRFVSNEQMEKDPRLKKFCEFYGVETGKGSYVARSFGHMQVGWFLNHSDAPNAHHKRYKYFAIRDIDANEEITIDYRVLCE